MTKESSRKNYLKHYSYYKNYAKEHKQEKSSYDKKYHIKNKEKRCAYARKYYEQNKDKIQQKQKIYNKEYVHRPHVKKRARQKNAEFFRTTKGRELRSKENAKRRKLGYNKLYPNPFADSVVIDWHHINDVDVVALPRDLHQVFFGNKHRERLSSVVKQIYK